MSEKPSPPPDADTDGRPPRQPVRTGTPLRAITAGLIVDLGGSLVLNLVLTVLYAVWLQATGLTAEQVDQAMHHIPPDSWAAIAGVLLGACIDVASGFVCARVVQKDEWRVGALLAGISSLCTLLLDDAGDATEDLTVLLSLTTAACTMLGVKYGREMTQRLKDGARDF